MKTVGLEDLPQPNENVANPINLIYPRSTVIIGVPLSPLHVSMRLSAERAHICASRSLLRYVLLQSLYATISDVASIGLRDPFCHPPI